MSSPQMAHLAQSKRNTLVRIYLTGQPMIETLETVEAIATPERVVCPSGVVSLLEMLELEAQAFVSLSTMLKEMETIGDVASKTNDALSEIDRHRIAGLCEILADMCI